MLFFSNVKTDALPAITHVDGTARVQSVGPTGDPRFRELLQAQARRTGYGVLCNTSLNFRGRGLRQPCVGPVPLLREKRHRPCRGRGRLVSPLGRLADVPQHLPNALLSTVGRDVGRIVR